MTTFTFAHFATGSKKVRSGKRRRASDDAFGGHHDRHGQHRRKGARLLRGHQLPACGTVLAPFRFLHLFLPTCGEKAAASREALQGRAYFPHREVSKLHRLWREVVIRQQAEWKKIFSIRAELHGLSAATCSNSLACNVLS